MFESTLQMDFEKAIDFLQQDNNLALFENVTERYLISNADYSPTKFIDYQVQVFGIAQEHTGILLHYFKANDDIPYNGKNKQTFKRINNIKRSSFTHFISMESSLVSPFKIKGNLFLYNQMHPHDIAATFVRADGEYFKFSFDYNEGMSLVMSFLQNLSQKFDQGINNIDRNEFYRMQEAYQNLSRKLENMIKEEDAEAVSKVGINEGTEN